MKKMSNSKNYYAFQYASGLNTTTGEPNPNTGRMSIAGYLAVFTDRKNMDAWVSAGKTTSDMSGNCRRAVTAKEARSLHRGMSVDSYVEDINMIVDIEVPNTSGHAVQ
jgi:hypothetical protein